MLLRSTTLFCALLYTRPTYLSILKKLLTPDLSNVINYILLERCAGRLEEGIVRSKSKNRQCYIIIIIIIIIKQ
jgi:hypothetical protein